MSNSVAVLLIQGQQSSLCIASVSLTLLLYDHAINLGDEVEHFWSGPWTFSRAMYLCIRYLGFTHAVIMGISNYDREIILTGRSVPRVFLVFAVLIIALLLCQAAITIRVWYMFTHSPIVRALAVTAFLASTVATGLLSGFMWKPLENVIQNLQSDRTPMIAWFYVPSLSLHSFLFALKIYRFMMKPQYLRRDTLLWRFLKEGMFMYACALGSLLFVVIGSTMTDMPQLPVYETALSGGDIVVAFTVISVCRTMLRLKSLAATMHVDPKWLLNHAELSRVHWRPGALEGEIVVEIPDYSFNHSAVSAKHVDSMLLTEESSAGPSRWSGVVASLD